MAFLNWRYTGTGDSLCQSRVFDRQYGVSTYFAIDPTLTCDPRFGRSAATQCARACAFSCIAVFMSLVLIILCLGLELQHLCCINSANRQSS